MTSRKRTIPAGLALFLAGCAASPAPVAQMEPPATEPLYRLDHVQTGRLEYAPDRSTFAPVLTEPFPYPTQPQANDAYRRLLATVPAGGSYPASVWLFGCKPGALDPQTVRITRYRRPVVHCSTDFLDASGRHFRRETVNFSYERAAWTMQPLDPPQIPVPWRNHESSPKDPWSWVPGRDRYE